MNLAAKISSTAGRAINVLIHKPWRVHPAGGFRRRCPGWLPGPELSNPSTRVRHPFQTAYV